MIAPSLIVCGPQAGWPSRRELSNLKDSLLHDPQLRPFLQAIRELPQLWPSLVQTLPELRTTKGLQLLDTLSIWTQGEDTFERDAVPPNIISTPLTAIIQIVQYFQLLRNLESTHAQVLESVRSGGIQGFCTGFLAASALVCSKDEQEINILGAVALRLAVCIGASVDLNGVEPTQATGCVAVRWKAETGRADIDGVLKKYPDVRNHSSPSLRQSIDLHLGICIRN